MKISVLGWWVPKNFDPRFDRFSTIYENISEFFSKKHFSVAGGMTQNKAPVSPPGGTPGSVIQFSTCCMISTNCLYWPFESLNFIENEIVVFTASHFRYLVPIFENDHLLWMLQSHLQQLKIGAHLSSDPADDLQKECITTASDKTPKKSDDNRYVRVDHRCWHHGSSSHHTKL